MSTHISVWAPLIKIHHFTSYSKLSFGYELEHVCNELVAYTVISLHY